MKNSGMNHHQMQAYEACVEVGKLLTSTLNLKEILQLIVLKVSQLIEADNWSLLLKDEKTNELTFDIVVGVDKQLTEKIRLSPGEGIAGQVLQTGEPKILHNVEQDTNFNRKVDEITGFHTRSIICVPLKNQGQVLGVMEIVNIKDIALFQERYLSTLMVLADFAAIAIQNSHFHQRIYQLSITDEYTGMYNARFLYQYLEDLTAGDLNQERRFAIIFVDIDNFKEIVDGYGHLMGSQVLREVGQTMTECIEENDVAIKYGGDEFVLIFLDVDLRQAIAKVERILEKIRHTPYLSTESAPVRLTASFGIAMYPDDAITPKELLIKSDQIMYSVKKSTKNGYGITG